MTSKVSYLCLTLLVIIGTQLASGKSVDERFKDDDYNALTISKRSANDESAEEDSVTLPTRSKSKDKSKEAAPVTRETPRKPAKSRRQSPKTTTQAPLTES